MDNTLPTPIPNGTQDIDLGQYQSDGTGEECMNLITVAQSSKTFLEHLTHIFNTRGYVMTAFGMLCPFTPCFTKTG